MDKIEKMRQEIDKLYGEYKDKFHQSGDQYHLGLIDGLDMAERVLDTLEEKSEIPTNGSSEKPNNHEGLDEEASRAGFDYVDDIVLLAEPNHRWNDHDVEQAYSDGFKTGAKWHADHTPLPEDTVIWNDGFKTGREIGARDMKEQMMEDIRLAYGKVSMNPFDCSEAFEELINKYEPNED